MDDDNLFETLEAWIITETWSESKSYLAQHPELLTDEAEALIKTLLTQMDDADIIEGLNEHLTLLRRARAEGIDMAFAERGQQQPRRYDDQTNDAVLAFINADSWDESKRIMEEHQVVLFTDAAEYVFVDLLNRYQDNAGAVRQLNEHLTLLRRARAEGIDAAFAERGQQTPQTTLFDSIKTWLTTDTWDESKSYLAQHSELLTDEAEALLNWIIVQADGESLVRESNEHLTLLRRARAEGIDAAFAERGQSSYDDQTNDAVLAFINADSWDESKRIVEEQQAVLFTDAAEYVFADLLNRYQDNEGAVRQLNEHLTLLRRARAEGIDAAFVDRIIPQHLREMFTTADTADDHYAAKGDLAMLEQAANGWETLLNHPDFQQAPLSFQLRIFNNASITLSRRYQARGNPADLDRAIALAEEALTLTPSDSPDRPSRLNNLGNRLSDRYARGGIGADLDRAIALAEEALTLTPSDSPDRPMMLNNLGIYLSDRYARGGIAADLDRAIGLAEEALTRTPSDSPDRPMMLNNLGTRLNARYARGGIAADLDRAIALGEEALKLTPSDSPDRPGRLNNLGNRLSDRYARGGIAADLDRAIALAEEVLTLTPSDSPDRPSLLSNLGSYLSDRYARGGSAADLDRAIDYYTQALTAYGDTFPRERRRTANNLADLFYDEQRYAEARTVYEQAHAAIQAMRSGTQRHAEKRRMSDENATLYARLVFCCLHTGDVEAAFTYATAGKGRAFVDLLYSAGFDLAALGTDDPKLQADMAHAEALRSQIAAIRARLLGEQGSTEMGDDLSTPERKAPAPTLTDAERDAQIDNLDTLYAQEKAHWETMAHNYPALTATQRAPDLTATDLRDLARTLGATLVEYFKDSRGWGAFVVTPAAVQHIRLPGLTNDLLRKMREHVATISQERNAIYLLLDQWYTAVITPVQAYLPTGGKVILAPEGALHLLPIGAARNPESKQYVCDEYLLAYVPSLAALSIAHQQASKPRPPAPTHRDLLCVAYPGAPDSEHYLPNVLPEAKKIAEGFPHTTPLYERAATPNNVVQHAAGHTVVHMACHGSFNVNYPDQSGLLLADGYLTLQRIIADLKLNQTNLFTMSACVTGRVDLTSGDELSGLSLAALTAGARVVVASLWAVNDTTTRLLFEQFYAKIQAGISPAQAMQAAAADLRQREGGKWKHPRYWAAFQVNGLAYQ